VAFKQQVLQLKLTATRGNTWLLILHVIMFYMQDIVTITLCSI